MCGSYFGSIVLIFICFNTSFTIETNLPIKELVDLNLAIEGLEKAINTIETKDNLNSEDKQSHKLAYFILCVITIVFANKVLKLESFFGSNPNVASKVSTEIAQVSDQSAAEALVNHALQIVPKPETSLISFQSSEVSNVDMGSLSVIPKKGIYPVLDDFLNLNW